MHLVGRDEELRIVHQAISHATSVKQLYTVGVAGPPGMGKSALLERVDEEAGEGAAAARVVVHDETGVAPFWPWSAVLRELARRHPAWDGVAASRPLLDSAVLHRLLPGVFPAGDAGSLEPDRVRLELFEAMRRLFEDLAVAEPIVLLFDNMHAFDAGSLALLRHLSRAQPAEGFALCVSYRPLESHERPEVARAISELRARDRHYDVELGPLDAEAVHAMSRNFSLPDAERAAEAALASSEGVPLFCRIRLAALEAEYLAGGAVAFEREVADSRRAASHASAFFGGRLRTLEPETRRLLLRAALVGDAVSAEVAECEGVALEDVIRKLQEAELAGLLVRTDGDGGFAFRHELVRRAVLETVSAAVRAAEAEELAGCLDGEAGEAGDRRIPAAAGGGAAGRGAGTRERDALRLWLQGASRQARLRAADLTVRLARSALTNLAWEEAIELVSHPRVDLSLLGRDERAVLKLVEGLARLHAEDRQRGQVILHEAFDELVSLGRFDDAQQLVLSIGAIDINDRDLFAVCEKALGVFGPDHPAHFAARARYVYALWDNSTRYGEARTLAREMYEKLPAQGAAEGAGDGTAAARVYLATLLAHMAYTAGDLDEARRLAQTFEPGRLDDSVAAELRSYGHVIHAELARVDGRLGDAEGHLREMVRWSRKTGSVRSLTSSLHLLMRAAVWQARWDEVEELGTECLRLHPRETPPQALLAISRYHRGLFGEGDEVLERLLSMQSDYEGTARVFHVSVATAIAARVYVSGAAKYAGIGYQIARDTLHHPHRHVHIRQRCLWSLAHLLAVLRGRDNAPAFRETDADLAAYAEELISAEPPNEFQRYHRYQAAAALSRLVGAHERARALLHSAHAEAEKLDDRVTRLYIAEALVATGEAGDVAELAARAEAMGLAPLASRLRAGLSAGVIGSAEAGGAGAGPGARAPRAPAGAVLSAREIEIVRLMVQGLADKEIARRLEISAHTVSNHVRNIRRKTGTSNRMAAASVVRGWGLLQ